MQSTRLLSAEELEACFAAPMRNVTEEAKPALDIWPYVDVLDLETLGLSTLNDVHHVYRDALDRFDQVLIGTGDANVLLVIIVDRAQKAVHGHSVLDLNEEYGLDDGVPEQA